MSQMVLKEDTSHIFHSLSYIRASFKMALFSLTLFGYFMTSGALSIFSKFFPQMSKKPILKCIGAYAKFCLRFMGIEVKAQGLQQMPHGLIVCNHLSYIDVLILAALKPACFVTSVEIKETPVLGQICQLAGCLFVERRSRQNLSKEVSELSSALKTDIPVLIFPEGTSTNGEEVLRFRRPLFQAAIDAQVPVVALSLNYLELDGVSVNKLNRDKICWYGEMSFLPHLWSFFQTRKLVAQVRVCEVFQEGSLEEYQLGSYRAVSENFKPLI